MSEKISSSSLAVWFQILSFLGLGLIPLVVFRTMMDSPDLASQPQVIGLGFIIICILGAFAGVRPSSFSRRVPDNQQLEEIEDLQNDRMERQTPIKRGHHYSCEPFSDHVLLFRQTVLCAGCTGLTTGAVIAIFGSVMYFFLEIRFFNGLVIFCLGFSGVLLGLVQHRIYRAIFIRSGILRFTLNVFFVVGAFLLLVGANQMTSSLAVDFYILCVILLWILNRIMISKGEHEGICKQCDDETCSHPLC